jgi:hypothetical protein
MQVFTSIAVSPPSAYMNPSTTQQFVATALDQYGLAMASQPTFTWAVSGGGTVSAGLFSAGSSVGGPWFVTATSGSISGRAGVILANVDVNGWTVITPSADSRLVYVDSVSGNDGTATYVLGNALGGQTPQNYTPAHPCATITQAWTMVRNGYPDWILLKCGETWHQLGWLTNSFGGRSVSEPFVVASYGTGAKPKINPPTDSSLIFYHSGATGGYMRFFDLDLYHVLRDPSSPSFDNTSAKATGFFWLGGGTDILLENCDVRFNTFGVVIQQDLGPLTAVTLRRCKLLDAYALPADSSDSSGLFVYGVDGFSLLECIFDHNGWNVPAGGVTTIRNHNTYIDECRNVTDHGNIFARAASLSCKFRSDNVASSTTGSTNTSVVDNFIFEGEVAMSLSNGTGSIPSVPSLTGFVLDHNVILQSNRDNPTGRDIGEGIDMNDISNAFVTNNVISDLSRTAGVYAINLGSGMQTPDARPLSNIGINKNVIYHLNGVGISINPPAGAVGLFCGNNDVQNADGTMTWAMLVWVNAQGIVGYAGNRYWNSIANQNATFREGPYSSAIFSNLAGWVTYSGETGATYGQVSYPDPARTVESYMTSLGQTATVDAWAAAIRAQTKGNWLPQYTANGINNYIRAGFGLAAFGAGAGNTAPVVNAGTDQSIALPATASLVGTATDDGFGGSTLTTTWSKLSGPGTVTFGNAAQLSTTATFSVAGSYVLRLTASDGTLSTTDDVAITVSAANAAPTVNAGADQAITLPSSANLVGTASDDGLPNPPATLTTTWSKVSGPGTVTFGNANATTTTATFSTTGTYVLRLTASDSVLSTADDITITVSAAPTGQAGRWRMKILC